MLMMLHFPQWFEADDDAGLSEEEVRARLKFRGDHAYASGRYLAAAEDYERCLAVTPVRAAGARRDLLEGLARSRLKSGELEEADRWAMELVRNFALVIVIEHHLSPN